MRLSAVLVGLMGLSFTLPLRADVLVDFSPQFDLKSVEKRDVELTQTGTTLRLVTHHGEDWPGFTLKAPNGHWDLSKFAYLELEVKNTGTDAATLCCRVDNPGADGVNNCLNGSVDLAPGAKGTIHIDLRNRIYTEGADKFFGMNGKPPGFDGIALANVTQLVIFTPRPRTDHSFEISNLRVDGVAQPAQPVANFFPFIDRYGQYMHSDWPNKIHDETDFSRQRTNESFDLTAHPAPSMWDKWGGWQKGPQAKATGFFRVEKIKGKWWLVDPDGRLFWSHGIDAVGAASGTTPITDRKHYFTDLPIPGAPFAEFAGQGNWAPVGYYKDKGLYETFDFAGANLQRKYGPQWRTEFRARAPRRLKSWGLNTIGNWSDSEIYKLRQMPYVVSINFGGKNLEGSQGYWAKFRDVFDPSFAAAIRERMAKEKGASADDPYCLGYFVDNELSWGNDTALAIAALVSPADQSAKRAMVSDLKAKYTTIEKLNAIWGSHYASWDALTQSTTAPDKTKARADLLAFSVKTAETYFQTCRDAIREVAPNQLYLGCRFSESNEFAVRAAAKFCDVVSYNLYRRDISDFRLPAGLDKPVIVGEFHAGALDRGMFHTGLQSVSDQYARARFYINYVEGALRNPIIVGTHWFEYTDEPTTGRGDGENYQIGFVDIADTPYPETIAASRQIGRSLYIVRGQ